MHSTTKRGWDVLDAVVVKECPTKQLCFFPHLLHVTSGRVSSCSQTPEDGVAPWAVLAEQSHPDQMEHPCCFSPSCPVGCRSEHGLSKEAQKKRNKAMRDVQVVVQCVWSQCSSTNRHLSAFCKRTLLVACMFGQTHLRRERDGWQ